MSNDKINKKNQFVKKYFKKGWTQFGLIFKTSDSSHEMTINPCAQTRKNNEEKFSIIKNKKKTKQITIKTIRIKSSKKTKWKKILRD